MNAPGTFLGATLLKRAYSAPYLKLETLTTTGGIHHDARLRPVRGAAAATRRRRLRVPGRGRRHPQPPRAPPPAGDEADGGTRARSRGRGVMRRGARALDAARFSRVLTRTRDCGCGRGSRVQATADTAQLFATTSRNDKP